jgi:hypothetical protein
MQRPRLTRNLTAVEFSLWYWLKEELQAFCRELGVASSGNKLELQQRIATVLSGGVPEQDRTRRPSRAAMPVEFTPSTVIGAGWTCSQPLRAYFTVVHGRSFRFNAALREFIAQGEGRTLADASECYESSRKSPSAQIAQQFEYNRHMREFHAANPAATHQQAVEAWWAHRGKGKS